MSTITRRYRVTVLTETHCDTSRYRRRAFQRHTREFAKQLEGYPQYKQQLAIASYHESGEEDRNTDFIANLH